MMKGAVGFALIALFLWSDPVSAASSQHHRHMRKAPYHRGLGNNADQAYVPLYFGPAIGTWRYRLLEPHCDDSYPFMESSCGTATGGPVGGTGS